MVQITIDLDIELDLNLQRYMISNQEECKNKNGNVDKRIAITNLLQEIIGAYKEEWIDKGLEGKKLKKGTRFEKVKSSKKNDKRII